MEINFKILRVLEVVLCGIMTCCKLRWKSVYHWFVKNKSKAIKIPWLSKLPSHLWYIFLWQIILSKIWPAEEFMTDATTPFAQPLTLFTFSLILSLPHFRLWPAFISPVTLHIRCWLVCLHYHWTNKFQQILFSFEGLPYNSIDKTSYKNVSNHF